MNIGMSWAKKGEDRWRELRMWNGGSEDNSILRADVRSEFCFCFCASRYLEMAEQEMWCGGRAAK